MRTPRVLIDQVQRLTETTSSPLRPPRPWDPQCWPRQTAASNYSAPGSPVGDWVSGSLGYMRFLPEALIKGRTLAERKKWAWRPWFGSGGLCLPYCSLTSERPHNVPEQSLGVRQECVFLLWCKPSHLILDPLNGPADNTDLYCPALQGLQHNRFSQTDIDLNGYCVSEFLKKYIYFFILDQNVDYIHFV